MSFIFLPRIISDETRGGLIGGGVICLGGHEVMGYSYTYGQSHLDWGAYGGAHFIYGAYAPHTPPVV